MKSSTLPLPAAVVVAVTFLASCGKSPEGVKPVASEAPQKAVVSETRLDAAIAPRA